MKTIIFDGYDDQKWYDEALSFLMEEYDCSENDLDDSEVEQLATEYKDEEEGDIYLALKKYFSDKSGQVFVVESMGRRNGASHGCQLFASFEKAFEFATDNCNFYEWSEDEDGLHLKASHHDGTNYVDFYLASNSDLDDELDELYERGVSVDSIVETLHANEWISVPHFLSWKEGAWR